MSVIFGMQKAVGSTVSQDDIAELGKTTRRYAPDDVAVCLDDRVGMGYQAYLTGTSSTPTCSVVRGAAGELLTLDGRLDNVDELCACLRLDQHCTKSAGAMLAAFRRWGEDSFSHFVGDWALALWVPKEQALYLARDHAGTRTLYYEKRPGMFIWSTYLESFFVEPRSFSLDVEYASRYLCVQPIRDLSPYRSIRSVLPAHFVVLRNSTVRTSAHWEWMSKSSTRYASHKDYEEHFLQLFNKSVERRDGPVQSTLAQLSGGMDSTSIVCSSDARKGSVQEEDLLDTISFFDDSEASSDERPYFSAVESHRGKSGVHVSMSYRERSFENEGQSEAAYLLPGADSSTVLREQKLLDAISTKNYRCILSGIGGDEVLGGVPSAAPELADYLIRGELLQFLGRTVDWCLVDRTPLLHTIPKICAYTVGLYTRPRCDTATVAPWIPKSVRECSAEVGKRDITNSGKWGLRPSSISQGLAWWSVMETAPHNYPALLWRPEYRYPYLDKELVDYLFSIPREQLLRPGRRRSLMRRALSGIVPDAILERRRKGYQVRAPLLALHDGYSKISRLFSDARLCQMGLLDRDPLLSALDSAVRTNNIKWWLPLVRAISLELFLRSRDGALL